MISLPLLGLLAVVTVPSHLQASQAGLSYSDSVAIERAVAVFLRSSLPAGAIGFDRSTNPLIPKNPITGEHVLPPRFRPPSRASDLADLLNARIVDFDSVLSCSGRGEPMACRLDGVVAVVRIGIPQRVGDSVLVWAYSRVASNQVPNQVPMEDTQVVVVLERGEWRVVAIRKRVVS